MEAKINLLVESTQTRQIEREREGKIDMSYVNGNVCHVRRVQSLRRADNQFENKLDHRLP